MTQSALEGRLRGALRMGAASIFVMTPVELALAEHVQSPIQLFPLIASGLGLVGVVCSRWAGTASRRVASSAFVLVCLVGVLGMWEHFEHNFAFEQEIHPTLATTPAALGALFGASPALAPGILILGAALAWASMLGTRTRARS
ncbi:MAG: hypothetical protein KUG77_19345 [Nannocystaceae bacterium]|nr:hypothetical protein [Nannocystaceae bacterium]